MNTTQKTLAGLILVAVVLVVCAIFAPKPKQIVPTCYYVTYAMQGGGVGATSMISKDGVAPTMENLTQFTGLVAKDVNTKVVITNFISIPCATTQS